ncbi:MAG TPA: glycerol-3-phosphate dehydrogenase/oxidase [Pyrinomonadaceae bacterium]|nr:glycerol-3-phosphate dehydrogenase/oxidase [Pyrinomonadaceae bacterium]
MNRESNIDRIRSRVEPWDIVVIGGGATGVGCALDAATRGLDVLLVEQNDFGSGTSSKSTKLVHGGVRYLKQGNISLVREALRERGLLLANAPHVVHKQEFIVPCRNQFEKLFYGIGLKLYDILAGKLSLGKSRFLSKRETLKRLPGIDANKVAGGISYWDGQFDDTRLLIDMAVTADKHGASLVNYLRVEALEKESEETVVGLNDVIAGELFETRARAVINATGAYCDPIRRMSDETAKPVVTFARGSHIVLSRDFLPSDAALMIPRTSDGRVLFCIPWLGHTLVGTTDVPCETAERGEIITDEEIDFLLETAGTYLSKQPTRDDILSKFAGVRPLVSRADTKNTSTLSRSHELFIDANGLVTITGGKWTTYREMAEQAVDAAIEIGKLNATECITKTLAIEPPLSSTGELLHPELTYTTGDVVRAFNTEMAQTINDALSRRTRISFLNESVAEQIREELSTDEHR